MTDRNRYTPGCHGYLVRIENTVGGTIPSWWYGPDRLWGLTSGPLDYGAEVFATRGGAKLALDRVGYGRKGTRIVTVAAAEREVAAIRATIHPKTSTKEHA